MKLKEGVTLAGLDIRMRPALMAAGEIWERHGQELVITEARDGAHSPGSLHYYGLALDMRTRDFDEQGKNSVYQELKGSLPERFDVVLHSSHIHVEYDIFK